MQLPLRIPKRSEPPPDGSPENARGHIGGEHQSEDERAACVELIFDQRRHEGLVEGIRSLYYNQVQRLSLNACLEAAQRVHNQGPFKGRFIPPRLKGECLAFWNRRTHS
jgi:hypothetical protein